VNGYANDLSILIPVHPTEAYAEKLMPLDLLYDVPTNAQVSGYFEDGHMPREFQGVVFESLGVGPPRGGEGDPRLADCPTDLAPGRSLPRANCISTTRTTETVVPLGFFRSTSIRAPSAERLDLTPTSLTFSQCCPSPGF